MYYADVKGEKPINYNGSKWLWVRDVETNKHLYFHMNCDCATDDDGKCILCGAHSPTTIERG